jgi:hypothetical protein
MFGDHCADSLFIGRFEEKNCTKNTVVLHLHTETVCNRFSVNQISRDGQIPPVLA